MHAPIFQSLDASEWLDTEPTAVMALYTEDRVSNPSLLIEGLYVVWRPAERNHNFVTTHDRLYASEKSMFIEKHTLQASERLLTVYGVLRVCPSSWDEHSTLTQNTARIFSLLNATYHLEVIDSH